MSTHPPVQCFALSKHFGETNALSSLDLTVPEGSIFALLGLNGAGKTTLIKILVNILKPSRGSASVLGVGTTQLQPKHFTGIGYVSESQHLPEWMTLDQLLAYLKPFYPKWDTALTAELVREFHLPGDRPLRKFSRGMKMKAALASSLAYHPPLLLLDEPFSGLDPLARDEFIQGLLSRAEETTIFISSHDLAEIETFSTHIAFLQSGRLQFAEEISTLNRRFREVDLILDNPLNRPSDWPPFWSTPQIAGPTLRFVDKDFDDVETPARIGQLLGSAKSAVYTPMSLRDIFLATAREREDLE